MPELDGKKYPYTKEGKKKYKRDKLKKLLRKSGKGKNGSYGDNNSHAISQE